MLAACVYASSCSKLISRAGASPSRAIVASTLSGLNLYSGSTADALLTSR